MWSVRGGMCARVGVFVCANDAAQTDFDFSVLTSVLPTNRRVSPRGVLCPRASERCCKRPYQKSPAALLKETMSNQQPRAQPASKRARPSPRTLTALHPPGAPASSSSSSRTPRGLRAAVGEGSARVVGGDSSGFARVGFAT